MTEYMLHSLFMNEAGIINKQTLISELKAYRLVNQVLLHTPIALKTIQFTTAEEIFK